MEQISITGILILIANLSVTYLGLRSPLFFEKYSFQVDEILLNKNYKRIITSGFLHISWVHLLFNMISFFCFSYSLELSIGKSNFLLLYFASLAGGNLFALYIHRNHYDYRSTGSSAAITGIIFASIAFSPGLQLSIFGFPYYMAAWAYGILYVLYSIYGIQSQKYNIGHEAHLGGGIIGLLAITLMFPYKIAGNYFPVVLILTPTFIFLYLLIKRPAFLLLETPYQVFLKVGPFEIPDEKQHTNQRKKEIELDEILDQINENGFNSLTQKEREKLEKLSKQ
ncbi:MAG: rhomboid family intramembrane serine protease [Bacteroidia bacterium]|nr:rhomboid family intramembrane serine protease [Bacteroidia bacterium]